MIIIYDKMEQSIKRTMQDNLNSNYIIPLSITSITLLGSYLYIHFNKKTLFRYISKLPYIRYKIDQKVQKEIDTFRKELEKDRFQNIDLSSLQTTLMDDSLPLEKIMHRVSQVSQYQKDEYKISGAIYVDENQWQKIVGDIYAQTAWLNPTHNSVWPNLVQMEAELYRMCSELFFLQESHGILTSGGTMSNMEAVYAYREKYELERNITKPNIVAPLTAHSSFRKACQILKVEYRQCKVNNKTGKADVKDMESKINNNTILLVASSPSFPYGIIDPIEQISDLALKYKVGMHLDACLGGFQVPFVELSEKCDFRNKGITSISADLHKFGKTPKGISMLMFRDYSIKKYLTYVDLKWSGGLYVMADFPGSRPGSAIVISWAMMNLIGFKNYQKTAHQLINMRQRICQKIKNLDDVYVYGKPELSTFGIQSQTLNIHFIDKMMKEKGWEFNSLPNGLHFCLTEKHLSTDEFETVFMVDLIDSINYVNEHPDEDPGTSAKIYCSTQEIPDYAEDILDEIGRVYIDVQTMVEPSHE